MAVSAVHKRIYYKCNNCGQETVRIGTQGPQPLTQKCLHSPKGPYKGPHSWVKVRTDTV